MPQATRIKSPEETAKYRISRGVREGALLVLTATTLYLLVALITYDSADQSWSHSAIRDEISNSGGRTGAWISDFLFYLFGYLGYLFPFLIGHLAWRISRGEGWRPEPKTLSFRILGFILTLSTGTSLATLHMAPGSSGLAMGAGGVLGSELSALLVNGFNLIGATLFLIALFLTGITWLTGLSWMWVAEWTGGKVFRISSFFFGQMRNYTDELEGRRAKQGRVAAAEEWEAASAQRKPIRIEPVIRALEISDRVVQESQIELFDDGAGKLPPLSLLDQVTTNLVAMSPESLKALSQRVENKLKEFNITAQVVEVHPGPVVTMFELELAAGVKVAQIVGLAKDLARAISVVSLRVVEVIPGRSTIGLEIPNESREMVRLTEVLRSRQFDEASSPLTLALGKDIKGLPTVVDLGKMPHMLVCGTTGSGKSVAVNAMILSLLFRASPSEVRLIMVDPKMLELSVYEGIPHLLTSVVTDMTEAFNALNWCVVEMERRYRLMSALGVRNLAGYNRKVKLALDSGAPIPDPFKTAPITFQEGATPEVPTCEPMPHIVVIVDELADMMMVVGKKVEQSIARLAQKARAAGIHLILATQRPSVDVITGLIKANIPARIAFQVSSKIDSRTILDQMGAENLLGHGDMLYLPPGTSIPQRLHGAFVSDEEVHRVVAELKKQGPPRYLDEILEVASVESTGFDPFSDSDAPEDDLYDKAVYLVTRSRRASVSGVQRHLRIGYNRAARLVEYMEQQGIVGPIQSNGSREVLAEAIPDD